jgi:hypothetical protein
LVLTGAFAILSGAEIDCRLPMPVDPHPLLLIDAEVLDGRWDISA